MIYPLMKQHGMLVYPYVRVLYNATTETNKWIEVEVSMRAHKNRGL